MPDSPKTWNLLEDIIIDILVTDPSTSFGLSGQVPYMTLILRRADGKYWNGAAWIATITELTVTEVDSTNEPGRYIYTLDGATGNTSATTYYSYLTINNPPTITANGSEVHVSRDLVVRVYAPEAG